MFSGPVWLTGQHEGRLQSYHSHTKLRKPHIRLTAWHPGHTEIEDFGKHKQLIYSALIHILATSVFALTLPSAFQHKVSNRNWQSSVCLGAVLSCNTHRRLFYVTLNDWVRYTNSQWEKRNTLYSCNFLRLLFTSIWQQKEWKRYTDFDKTRFSSWVCWWLRVSALVPPL